MAEHLDLHFPAAPLVVQSGDDLNAGVCPQGPVYPIDQEPIPQLLRALHLICRDDESPGPGVVPTQFGGLDLSRIDAFGMKYGSNQ